MEHPSVIHPVHYAEWRADKMGKATIFESTRLLVGLNCFEAGQSHALHSHHGMDKVYQVIEGTGLFLLEKQELPMTAGDLLVAPDGVPQGVKNPGPGRLLVLAILAPSPR
jgi:mannose-6-phosphate isomerase-like protein (cupin superfamily)